jgi:hypothetical protein
MVVKMSDPRPHSLDSKPGQFKLMADDVGGALRFYCPEGGCFWFGITDQGVSLTWLNRVAEGHLEEMIQVDPRYQGDGL